LFLEEKAGRVALGIVFLVDFHIAYNAGSPGLKDLLDGPADNIGGESLLEVYRFVARLHIVKDHAAVFIGQESHVEAVAGHDLRGFLEDKIQYLVEGLSAGHLAVDEVQDRCFIG
jgi:hypothetical protein